ncbi:hypothetical protein BUALT_Bualt16G0033400 [Buddleja alternifolia]|uniref:LOB domain-containing protein n=1 Tax=Buddleja alternifolia TaxID=168488 RepID=A0AAV6W6D6_9LAMI|nr:hypothetical protein BUALT_Bualt16G0033400 [Buddleja alternifolia]
MADARTAAKEYFRRHGPPSNTACAACKCLRRRCTNDCVFAPYFPPDHTIQFKKVQNVFGASNVAKHLNALKFNPDQRENAVKSLVYEAEYRLSEPIHGVAGLVSLRQKQLKEIYMAVVAAKKELATYIGPHAAFSPFSDKQPMGKKREPQQDQQLQQQLLETQQMQLAREQELLMAFELQKEQQQQQRENATTQYRSQSQFHLPSHHSIQFQQDDTFLQLDQQHGVNIAHHHDHDTLQQLSQLDQLAQVKGPHLHQQLDQFDQLSQAQGSQSQQRFDQFGQEDPWSTGHHVENQKITWII